MVEPVHAKIREATLEDCEPVLRLIQGFGLSTHSSPEAVRASWDGLWLRNPARGLGRPLPPLGWILEAQDRVVGFFGSLPIRYQFGDQTLIAGVGTRWAVEKPFRGQTGDLASAYFEQPGVDLLLGTSGIPASGRLYLGNGGAALPVPDYDRVPFWVLASGAFARAALRQKGLSAPLAAAGATLLGPGIAALAALGRKGPRRTRMGLDPEAIRLEEVGDEFDDLWRRKLAEGPRLYAWRTGEDIRWHFEERDHPRSLTLLRCRHAGRLAGYLVWEREDVERYGLARARIADLFVEHDAPEVLEALLAAAHETARAQGCHVLELQGFSQVLPSQVGLGRSLSRTLTPISFCYKARTPELQMALSHADAWYPSLFDGDGSLG